MPLPHPSSLLVDTPHQEPIITIFERQDIERGDFEEALTALLAMASSASNLREYANRLIVMFGGYDADPRDLWAIPEVCQFVQQLSQAFPYWFHFCSKSDRQLSALMFCHVAKRSTPVADDQGCVTIMASRTAVQQLRQDWLNASRRLYRQHGMPFTAYDKLENAVDQYLARTGLLAPQN